MNNKEVLLVPNKSKVNRIIHLSDIHISNDINKKVIYEKVFKNLFDIMKKKKITTNDLVVITGDIIDQADFLTPECIKLTKDFFIGLTDFCDVCFILGNHEQKRYDIT